MDISNITGDRISRKKTGEGDNKGRSEMLGKVRSKFVSS